MKILKLLGGFLGKFSIKQYIYAGLAALALTFAIKGMNWFTGIQDEVRNLREANTEYQTQVQALEIEKQSNEIAIESMQMALETQAEALQLVNGQFDEIRDQREQQKRVLEGSRLGRLAAERAGLIESQSNSATAERFAEFEGVINENF